MRISRSLAGLLSAALLGLVPVAIAGPAEAATTTRVQFAISQSKATYGAYIYVRGAVEQSDGESWSPVPFDSGTADLQVSAAGGDWRTVATDTSPDNLYFPTQRARSNAVYRVVYSGDATYSPSTSANRRLKVVRIFNERVDRLVFKGKMTPRYQGKKVLIQVKAGRWKAFKTIRTDRRSRWSIKLPARKKRTYFRAVVPGDKKFAKSISRSAYTYRF